MATQLNPQRAFRNIILFPVIVSCLWILFVLTNHRLVEINILPDLFALHLPFVHSMEAEYRLVGGIVILFAWVNQIQYSVRFMHTNDEDVMKVWSFATVLTVVLIVLIFLIPVATISMPTAVALGMGMRFVYEEVGEVPHPAWSFVLVVTPGTLLATLWVLR